MNTYDVDLKMMFEQWADDLEEIAHRIRQDYVIQKHTDFTPPFPNFLAAQATALKEVCRTTAAREDLDEFNSPFEYGVYKAPPGSGVYFGEKWAKTIKPILADRQFMRDFAKGSGWADVDRFEEDWHRLVKNCEDLRDRNEWIEANHQSVKAEFELVKKKLDEGWEEEVGPLVEKANSLGDKLSVAERKMRRLLDQYDQDLEEAIRKVEKACEEKVKSLQEEHDKEVKALKAEIERVQKEKESLFW